MGVPPSCTGEAFFNYSLFFLINQEIVPAHLMTSPIPTEEALFRGREPRGGGSGTEKSQPLSPEQLVSGNPQTCSSTANKKRKRRRKKHKVEPRKEEQSRPAGGEVELCELSSDEDGQWLVTAFSLKAEALFVVNLELILLFLVLRVISFSTTKDNQENRQHSPITALEWDSYPFSDGDWSPCTTYDSLTPCKQMFAFFIQKLQGNNES